MPIMAKRCKTFSERIGIVSGKVFYDFLPIFSLKPVPDPVFVRMNGFCHIPVLHGQGLDDIF
jgi:hypothetical protein